MVAYDLGLQHRGVDYILTNPGPDTEVLFPELGASFEKPIHNYDAVEVTLDRRFWATGWAPRPTAGRGCTARSKASTVKTTASRTRASRRSTTSRPTIRATPRSAPRSSATAATSASSARSARARCRSIVRTGQALWQLRLRPRTSALASRSTALGQAADALAANPHYDNAGEIPTGPRGSGIETIDGFKKRTPFEFQADAQASYVLRFGGAA